jgi:hypothetical protein
VLAYPVAGYGEQPEGMVRLGSDGLAFITPDAILLVNGAIIAN